MAEYAGIEKRIVAIIVDSIALWVVGIILALPLGLYAAAVSFTGMADMTQMLNYMGAMMGYGALMTLVSLGYYTYFEGNGKGQTLGKMLMKIKVTKENGKAPNYGDALIRTILRIVDGIGGYLVGFIIVLVSEKKQRLGDMAAKTIVVNA